jgi:hypothetical protein
MITLTDSRGRAFKVSATMEGSDALANTTEAEAYICLLLTYANESLPAERKLLDPARIRP